jgi:Putative Ig domain
MNRTGSRSLSLKMILISTVTLLLAVTAICFAVPDGDVDGDGRVTGADALKILRAAVGLDPVTPRMLAHGDVAPLGLDGKPQPDGIISIADALIILQKSIGLVYWDSSFTPPHITSSAPLTATGSQPYRYQVVAVITDGLTATYALTKAPAGMAIDGAKGSINWTPGSAQTGNFDVTVMVTDSNGDIGRQSFVLQVKDGTPPTVVTITSQPPLKTFDNHPYRYQVSATLSAGMKGTYSLETAPTGMTIDSATGLITWMPGTDQIGNRQVPVSSPVNPTRSKSSMERHPRCGLSRRLRLCQAVTSPFQR